MAAVIVGLPVLALGLPATTAAAATVGTVTIQPLKPNGSSIGRITTADG